MFLFAALTASRVLHDPIEDLLNPKGYPMGWKDWHYRPRKSNTMIDTRPYIRFGKRVWDRIRNEDETNGISRQDIINAIKIAQYLLTHQEQESNGIPITPSQQAEWIARKIVEYARRRAQKNEANGIPITPRQQAEWVARKLVEIGRRRRGL